jgi:replication factor A1
LVQGAKVAQYGGKNLSFTSLSVMQINPDIPEAHTLRGWFDQGGCNSSELVTLGGTGSHVGNFQTAWKTLDCLEEEQMGMRDKGDYMMVKGTVMYTRKDNSMYMACPGEHCNKKVIDQNDGTYRCEKCSKNYDHFNWRMILSISLAIIVTLTGPRVFRSRLN